VKAGKYVFRDATDSIVKELDAEGMQAFLKEMDVDLGDMTWGGGIGTNKTSIDTYEALLGSMSEKELKAIQKVDERQLLNQIDYDEVMAFGEGLSGGGTKTISYTEYNDIYKSSIHNAGKDKVMLGKYDGGGDTSYISKAGSDYEYFDLGEKWDIIKEKHGYTDGEMFKLFNESFLDDGINAGKTFQFSHNPINDIGALGQEYQYLLKNNYKWDAGTMTMRPRY